MYFRTISLFALCAVVGCGTNIESESVRQQLGEESQCGPTWDVQDVESYNGNLGVTQAFVAKHERRVGYLVGAGCTGTLISDDLFISAGHCEYAIGNTVRFNYQNAPNGTARATRDFTVASVVEQENNSTWDYAIVRLNGKPGIEYGHSLIAPVDPPAGSHVTIIQHPNREPKKVHAGTVVDYSSSEGSNWFRHQVDTTGGTSGSGVLDDFGRIVGIHTNAGCSTGNPQNGNSAIRMSQLISHSTTLQAISRSKIMWSQADGRISLWSVNYDGSHRTYKEHGPYAGWTPVNINNNRILWNHTSGKISLWTVDSNGNFVSYKEHGPYAGWTAVNYANNRILWNHTSGKISLWTVDDSGNFVSYKEHGPYAGWTAVNYANNRILWRHTSGKISLWTVDDSSNFVSYKEHGPYTGWTAQSYSNSEILWTHTTAKTSLWTVDVSSNLLSYGENGPYAGWTPIANADGHLLWRHNTGKISYWNTGSNGEFISYKEHGPFSGWSAFSIAGER